MKTQSENQNINNANKLMTTKEAHKRYSVKVHNLQVQENEVPEKKFVLLLILQPFNLFVKII